MVRQAVRQAHGPEQSRRTHHPEPGRRANTNDRNSKFKTDMMTVRHLKRDQKVLVIGTWDLDIDEFVKSRILHVFGIACLVFGMKYCASY